MLRALIFTTFIRCALGSFVNESVTCVIMALNDVYKYFHLSQVASAKRNENPHYLVSLGDFTGPSPHSFFDSGRGMHNLFNSIGVNLTIFGEGHSS